MVNVIKDTTTYHTASSRGEANHGWLYSRHTFSFANYYNPDRMGFGVLRVLNDDIVAPAMGFGTHPHSNMEIISIPLHGDLEHKDSMGNSKIIEEGDVQIMSAGSGIVHSEFNANKDREVSFLQIWVEPNRLNTTPTYEQITLQKEKVINQLFQIVSPNTDDDGVHINQDVWFHLGEFTDEKTIQHRVNKEGNGIYFFVIEGSLEVNDHNLTKRDGLGLSNTQEFTLKPSTGSKILLMEVPMNNKIKSNN